MVAILNEGMYFCYKRREAQRHSDYERKYLPAARQSKMPELFSACARGGEMLTMGEEASGGGNRKTGTLTPMAFVPHVLTAWRTRSARDIYLSMYLVVTTGVAPGLSPGIRRHAAADRGKRRDIHSCTAYPCHKALSWMTGRGSFGAARGTHGLAQGEALRAKA